MSHINSLIHGSIYRVAPKKTEQSIIYDFALVNSKSFFHFAG